MKNIFLFCMVVVLSTFGMRGQGAAQAANSSDPKGPDMEYVCQLLVSCGQAYTVGQTAHGARMIIPITGGTFEGPKMKGTVLSGGADYQLVDMDKGRNEVEAIYTIKTDDGVYIHIRNCGLIYMNKEGNGGPGGFYFRTAPKFEAPSDSKYDWLNNSIFVCVPSMVDGFIALKVWRIL